MRDHTDQPHCLATVAEKTTSRGIHGIVSATAPEAAAIGRDALRDGGNAFDAALTAALAETVLLPPKCGLAGDLVALCVRPSHEPAALIAIGPAAAGLGEAVRAGGELPRTGGLAVGVPGAPAGYAALAGLGVLGLTQATRPAARLAETGFPWSSLNHHYARQSRDLLQEQNPGGNPYLPHGRLIRVGARTHLPGLAKALDEFAHRGGELFAGPLGDAAVAAVQASGGLITYDDLTRPQARWERPVSLTTEGQRVWATSAPTHGPSLLAALESSGSDITDPATVYTSVQTAIDRRARQAGAAAPGAGTSVVTAADEDGNAVVVVHSNSHPTFGSGIVLPDYDLILSNRAGRGFSPRPGHPNFPAPGRRPITTLHAWGLGTGNYLHTLGATSGGENQMPWNAQLLARLLAGAEHAPAILAPFWARRTDGGIDVEEGFSEHDRAALQTITRTTDVPRWSLPSGLQTVSLPTAAKPLTATADIRSIGGTVGL